MGRLVERQGATDVMMRFFKAMKENADNCISELASLSDAGERAEGHWKWSLADNGWADHTCSVCGYTENTDIHVTLNWNFCPKCGAKMKKE